MLVHPQGRPCPWSPAPWPVNLARRLAAAASGCHLETEQAFCPRWLPACLCLLPHGEELILRTYKVTQGDVHMELEKYRKKIFLIRKKKRSVGKIFYGSCTSSCGVCSGLASFWASRVHASCWADETGQYSLQRRPWQSWEEQGVITKER